MSAEHKGTPLTIAASSDFHISTDERRPRYYSLDKFGLLLHHMAANADIVILPGDIISKTQDKKVMQKTIEETAGVFADVISESNVPIVGVLGNNDKEYGHGPLVSTIFQEVKGVTMLEGNAYVIGDVGIAGVSGYKGGFADELDKKYRRRATEENNKLKKVLATLTTSKKLVVSHYAPIEETLYGESVDAVVLGNAGLETIADQDPDVVGYLHGHAHSGYSEGKTRAGIPVYNVALEVLRRESGTEKTFEPSKLYRTITV